MYVVDLRWKDKIGTYITIHWIDMQYKEATWTDIKLFAINLFNGLFFKPVLDYNNVLIGVEVANNGELAIERLLQLQLLK